MKDLNQLLNPLKFASHYDRLLQKLQVVCDVVSHKLTDHPGFPEGYGRNYWDSLFIRKNVI